MNHNRDKKSHSIYEFRDNKKLNNSSNNKNFSLYIKCRFNNKEIKIPPIVQKKINYNSLSISHQEHFEIKRVRDNLNFPGTISSVSFRNYSLSINVSEQSNLGDEHQSLSSNVIISFPNVQSEIFDADNSLYDNVYNQSQRSFCDYCSNESECSICNNS